MAKHSTMSNKRCGGIFFQARYFCNDVISRILCSYACRWAFNQFALLHECTHRGRNAFSKRLHSRPRRFASNIEVQTHSEFIQRAAKSLQAPHFPFSRGKLEPCSRFALLMTEFSSYQWRHFTRYLWRHGKVGTTTLTHINGIYHWTGCGPDIIVSHTNTRVRMMENRMLHLPHATQQHSYTRR